MGASECRRPCGALVNIYIYIYDDYFWRVLFRIFFRLGLSMGFSELEVLGQIVRAPSSGGGSNALRPALSVPHLDVNADGC